MYRDIEKMTTLVQHKTPQQQFNSIYHFALIKIVVIHQFGLQDITWEDFISREFFTAPQGPPEVLHETGEPSYQHDGHQTQTASMPVFITYQKGTRQLFAATKRVLSPLGVEGVSLPSSAQQVLDKGKRPLQDEGPSGERETDFILIEGDDTDMGPQSTNLREIIQEQQADIDALSINLDKTQWTIQYLEQRNKQLEDQQSDCGVGKHSGELPSCPKEEGGVHFT